MIGNDAVWLADPDNRGRCDDRRLTARVLTPSERLLVQIASDGDRMLWSLWAAKEAAFKAWSRDLGSPRFSPSAFEVVPDPATGGATVRHGNWSVNVTWSQGTDWVHAVAFSGTGRTLSRVESCPQGRTDSQAARDLAVRLLASAGVLGASVTGRPPRFVREGLDLPYALSLSHDGPYCAAALVLPAL